MMPMGPMMGWNGGGWGFGFVFMLLLWVLLIVAIVALIRWMLLAGSGGRQSTGGRDHALEILRERYARGEITPEEFEAKRRDLR
jgi:putative membrane protein